jgi:hypothetical protein
VADATYTVKPLDASTWDAFAALAGALDLIAGLGGGLRRGLPGGRRIHPRGLPLQRRALTYERLGFVRDRKIGKNRWVVTRVVESSSRR